MRKAKHVVVCEYEVIFFFILQRARRAVKVTLFGSSTRSIHE